MTGEILSREPNTGDTVIEPTDERHATLMEAGLTGYQAKAYLTLIRLRGAKVLPLARASGIPRNKLYHVLAELEKLQLVEARSRDPLEYRAVSIRAYLESRVKRLSALLDELSDHGHFGGP